MSEKQKYKIRKSKRAKRLRLAVYCDGSVVVTTPISIQQSIVEKFLADKRQWISDKVNFFKAIDNKAIKTFSDEDYQKYKEKAFKLVERRVKAFNKIYTLSFNKINIRNQKTRWGSCSKKKNLNINYKIVFLPREIQNYIIVHEMCHLKEFNHSRKFWLLVQKALPKYLEIKKKLRRHELLY